MDALRRIDGVIHVAPDPGGGVQARHDVSCTVEQLGRAIEHAAAGTNHRYRVVRAESKSLEG